MLLNSQTQKSKKQTWGVFSERGFYTVPDLACAVTDGQPFCLCGSQVVPCSRFLLLIEMPTPWRWNYKNTPFLSSLERSAFCHFPSVLCSSHDYFSFNYISINRSRHNLLPNASKPKAKIERIKIKLVNNKSKLPNMSKESTFKSGGLYDSHFV